MQFFAKLSAMINKNIINGGLQMKKVISFVLILFMLSLPACKSDRTESVSKETKKEDPSHISITVLGDNLMHMPVINSGKQADGSYDYSHIFTELQPYINDTDIAVIGQETVFAGESRGYSGYPLFNSPSDVGKSLVNEGFDIVLHASNHTMDQGSTGVENTLKFWDNYPQIKVLGINKSKDDAAGIKTFEKKGVKFGVLNYTYGTNGIPVPSGKDYLVDVIDENLIKREVYMSEKATDFTIAFMHWGEEDMSTPSEFQKELAQKMCDWGVDLIVGSHPHVIQGAQWLEGKNGNKTFVYYSLGNFVSRQIKPQNLLGGIADIKLAIKDGKPTIENACFKPIVTHYNKGCTDFCVYPLEKYSDKLADVHGIIDFGHKMSISGLEKILYNTFEGFDENLIDYK